jgi:putative hydrolase of the HAD superfamily
MPAVTTVAFDADDTLWHNERFFRMTHDHFARLLADHADPATLHDRLTNAERRNLGHYGFGIKGFILSMIETALEVTDNRVPGSVIRQIVAAGQDMLRHPVELLPHARETITALTGRYRLLLITKGDLLDQERKIAMSGLGDLFDAVEIVSDKTAPVYADVFLRHATDPARTVMVGNSLKSDVLPVLAIGGWGVHVPHDLTWTYEHETAPTGHPRFAELAHLGLLPDWIGTAEG